MDLIESIKAVQEAHDNNRLVIFVGSGVSRNSGIPTWRELIEKIAKKIKYRDSMYLYIILHKKSCSLECFVLNNHYYSRESIC